MGKHHPATATSAPVLLAPVDLGPPPSGPLCLSHTEVSLTPDPRSASCFIHLGTCLGTFSLAETRRESHLTPFPGGPAASGQPHWCPRDPGVGVQTGCRVLLLLAQLQTGHLCTPCQAFLCPPCRGGACPGSPGPARNACHRLESQAQQESGPNA